MTACGLVHLAADNGVDADRLRGEIKINRAEHVAVVGNGEGTYALTGYGFKKFGGFAAAAVYF